MKYLLFILSPFLIFAQSVDTKKFGDVRVKEQVPVIESGYDFDDIMGTYAFDTTYIYSVTDSLAEDIGSAQDAADVVADSLSDYVLEDDLDSLVTVSPTKDSILNIVTDALEDSSFTDDLRIPISSVRLPNSNAPAATLYLGGEVLAFPTNADATVYFEFQMPHARVDDSDINIHLHYALSDNGTNPDSVRWVLTYTWANIDAQFPTPTTANHTEYVSTYVDSTHYYDVIATITGTGKTLSSMLICSLTRDVSEDDYGGSVYMIEIDAHYLRRNYTSPQSLF